MMAKKITRYVCQQCGRASASYMGKCPQCGAFNSMTEEIVHSEAVQYSKAAVRGLSGRSEPRQIAKISGDVEERIPLAIGEFARVLGGGIVPGSIVLVGGDPGIGKSTLMLQMAMEEYCMFQEKNLNGRSKCVHCGYEQEEINLNCLTSCY
jgi:DNA repair protein RadA/Sms